MDKQSRQGNTISSSYYGQVRAVCLGLPQVHLFFFIINFFKKKISNQREGKKKKKLVTGGCLQKIENEEKEKK